MRILRNSLLLARICGPRAGLRYARHATLIALAAGLDEWAALLQLWRARILQCIE